MNERILDIVVKADKDYALATVPAETLEKFAELIVRECADIVYEIGAYSNGLTKNKTSRNGLFASMIGKTIKKEFGIEV